MRFQKVGFNSPHLFSVLQIAITILLAILNGTGDGSHPITTDSQLHRALETQMP